jgi:hypothetical protein
MNITRPDGIMIEELTKLAKVCHKRHSKPVTDALMERILSVSSVRCLNKIIT